MCKAPTKCFYPLKVDVVDTGQCTRLKCNEWLRDEKRYCEEQAFDIFLDSILCCKHSPIGKGE